MTLETILILVLIIITALLISIRFRKKPAKSHRPPGAIIPEVQQKLNNGENTVSVIKYVREETGLGLEAAKKFVDNQIDVNSGTYVDETELMMTVEEMLQDGESDIEIIKYVRKTAGFGLKDAKDYVDGVKEEVDRLNNNS